MFKLIDELFCSINSWRKCLIFFFLCYFKLLKILTLCLYKLCEITSLFLLYLKHICLFLNELLKLLVLSRILLFLFSSQILKLLFVGLDRCVQNTVFLILGHHELIELSLWTFNKGLEGIILTLQIWGQLIDRIRVAAEKRVRTARRNFHIFHYFTQIFVLAGINFLLRILDSFQLRYGLLVFRYRFILKIVPDVVLVHELFQIWGLRSYKVLESLIFCPLCFFKITQ